MFSNYIILECLLYLIIPVLVGLAFLTLAERKIMGYLQQRRGPNVEGFLGFLQPIFDGLKLLQKESIVPKKANLFLFLLAPILIFALSLLAWVVLPFSEYGGLVDLKISVIYILAISSLHVYGIIIAGWSSNSRYAFLGALRSTAQMISYELAVGLILLTINMCAGSLHIYDIVDLQENIWLVCPLFPFFIIFFIASLAELNRAPFDLPEAEGELVAGYNVEYSSMGFALFFLAEYANILFMSTLNVLLFFGGWNNFGFTLFTICGFDILFFIKISILVFLKIWVRAAFPRYRYDQLMRLGWKIFLPITLALFCVYSLILFIFTI